MLLPVPLLPPLRQKPGRTRGASSPATGLKWDFTTDSGREGGREGRRWRREEGGRGREMDGRKERKRGRREEEEAWCWGRLLVHFGACLATGPGGS